MMSEQEARSLFNSAAGNKKYDEEKYTNLLSQITAAYQKQLKIAGQMDKLVSTMEKADKGLTKLFI